MTMNEVQLVLAQLGVALAIGLLIGTERAWQGRTDNGEPVAGVRTFGLIGLLGGASAVLASSYGNLLLGLIFIAVAAILVRGYLFLEPQRDDTSGLTSPVAGLLTFVLGALAGMGELTIAAATSVVVTLLLSRKPTLHRWVRALEAKELHAGLKLLLISVVLLPILPNVGYGPWKALNPFEIWLMVVMIAAISFVGYFAVKIGGTRRGALFTGMFGGLASSTALTLNFSRLARQNPDLAPALATGILLACGTMFPRMLLVASVINPRLFELLLIPSLVMLAISYGAAILTWRTHSPAQAASSPIDNPLELKSALSFGLLLSLVMLLGHWLRESFGDQGILVLAAASGVADVDAINLSLSRMSLNDLGLATAATGIVIGAGVNTLVKAGMATMISGGRIGLQVGLPLAASVAGGLVTTLFSTWA